MSQNMNCKVLLAKYFLLELLFQEKKKYLKTQRMKVTPKDIITDNQYLDNKKQKVHFVDTSMFFNIMLRYHLTFFNVFFT